MATANRRGMECRIASQPHPICPTSAKSVVTARKVWKVLASNPRSASTDSLKRPKPEESRRSGKDPEGRRSQSCAQIQPFLRGLSARHHLSRLAKKADGQRRHDHESDRYLLPRQTPGLIR